MFLIRPSYKIQEPVNILCMDKLVSDINQIFFKRSFGWGFFHIKTVKYFDHSTKLNYNIHRLTKYKIRYGDISMNEINIDDKELTNIIYFQVP